MQPKEVNQNPCKIVDDLLAVWRQRLKRIYLNHSFGATDVVT
jgi:hypothetical protein